MRFVDPSPAGVGKSKRVLPRIVSDIQIVPPKRQKLVLPVKRRGQMSGEE